MEWWNDFWEWAETSQLGANVVGGLIVAAILALGGLILTLARKSWREKVWGAVVGLVRWVVGLQILTAKQRERLDEVGYDRRSAEVAAQRKKSPRPTWRVSHTKGDDFIYVHNSGWWVEDVVVHADPALFVFADGAKSGFIKGRLGDNVRGGSSGKAVSGTVTAKGLKEGVEFTFSWIDQNGDPQPKTGGDEMPNVAVLAAVPPLPHIQPTWQIGKPKQTRNPEIFALANGAKGSITKNVRIDANPSLFTFTVKKELGDLEGVGILPFAGRPTEYGTHFGVEFEVTYEDVNGEERTETVPAKFGFSL